MTKRVRLTLPDSAPKARANLSDSLENFVSGMGTASDKEYYTRWINTVITPQQVNAAYRGDWIARKVIDIPADDGTREWRRWTADKKDITAIEELETALGLQRKLLMADRRARGYGGAALVIGVDQGSAEEPINLNAIKKDSFKFLHAVSRHELSVEELEMDITSPYYGTPKMYIVNSRDVQTRIHPDRIVRMIGAEPLDPLESVQQGWGDSVLQIVADAIRACGSVSQNVASLLHELQVDIVGVPDLINQLGASDYEERLKRRFGLAATTKSIHKVLVLDKDEDWHRVTANLSGLHELIKVYLLIASGAADIPATRFLGQSPQGMNATGDSDIRNYYDKVRARQTNEYNPAMKILNEVLVRSALGAYPDGIFFTWNPLWQMDEQQRAELAKKKADTFKTDVDTGLIEAPILREARINQLIEDDTYPGLEQTIDDMELSGELDEFREQQEEIAAQIRGQQGNEEDENAPPQEGTQDAKPRHIRYRPRDFGNGRFSSTRMRKAPKEIDDLIKSRMGKSTSDALVDDGVTLRTLYVRRDVLNGADIIRHFRKHLPKGTKLIKPATAHITLAHSKVPVDWYAAGESYYANEDGKTTIRPGGPRVVEQFGNAIVQVVACEELVWRHESIHNRTGAVWEYENYIPHITVTYAAPDGINIADIPPYQGPIVLGPEIFEEIDPEGAASAMEDTLRTMIDQWVDAVVIEAIED